MGDELGDDGGVRADPAGVVVEHWVSTQLKRIDDVAVVCDRDRPDRVQAAAAVGTGSTEPAGG